jgi:hypothetical protein
MEHINKAEAKGREGEEDKKEEEEGLNLFAATGVQLPKYWLCICYIAPSKEKKNWTSGNATGVFCTQPRSSTML